MNKTLSQTRPSTIEKIGLKKIIYRWDIQSRQLVDPLTNESYLQYEYYQVVVYCPITANKITLKVIESVWPVDYEQKLVNDYNAARLNLYDADTAQLIIDRYTQFLQDRQALKDQIDADCVEAGIPLS
jgi:hypothetical protein